MHGSQACFTEEETEAHSCGGLEAAAGILAQPASHGPMRMGWKDAGSLLPS